MKNEDKLEDSYNPFEHREVKKPLTNFEATIHIVKACLGTGITALPEAVREAGLLVGSAGIVVIGIITTHSLHMLIDAINDLCRRHRVPFLTYRESMRLGVKEGPPLMHRTDRASAVLTDFCLTFNALGIVCIYLLYVSQNIKKVADQYMDELNVRIWMLILMPFLAAMMMIRNLKRLVPLSHVANISLLLGVAFLMYFILQDLPPPCARPMAQSILNLPMYAGKVFFSYMAVGVIISVESEMKKPQSFGQPLGVLNLGMAVVVVVYTSVGFLGYLKYGEATTQGSVTLQLPKEPLADAVNLVFALGVFASAPLQLYVGMQILVKIYLMEKFERTGHPLFCEYALRIGICLAMFCVALVVPYLELFISLIGAVVFPLGALLFPALLDFCLRWSTHGTFKGNMYLLRDILYMLLGLMTFVVGCTISIKDILLKFYEEHNS